MRRCIIKVKPLDLSGIGFQVSGARCQQTPNPETRNLNTDLVAAQGLHCDIQLDRNENLLVCDSYKEFKQ